jgi:hypothetical protein
MTKAHDGHLLFSIPTGTGKLLVTVFCGSSVTYTIGFEPGEDYQPINGEGMNELIKSLCDIMDIKNEVFEPSESMFHEPAAETMRELDEEPEERVATGGAVYYGCRCHWCNGEEEKTPYIPEVGDIVMFNDDYLDACADTERDLRGVEMKVFSQWPVGETKIGLGLDTGSPPSLLRIISLKTGYIERTWDAPPPQHPAFIKVR